MSAYGIGWILETQGQKDYLQDFLGAMVRSFWMARNQLGTLTLMTKYVII